MKTLKCPLCGTSLQFFLEPETEGMGRVGCLSCEWVTLLNLPHQAWRDAEKLIAKFPPILRIHKGDKAMVYDRIFTVRKVNTDLATIYFDGIYGEPFYVHDIQKWPWELEQTKEEDK